MNTNEYIKVLKSELSVLEKNKRDEIIKEIESYILESQATYELLIERFGEPKELANSYIEEIEIDDSKAKKIYSKTKKIALVIFTFLVVLVVGISLFIYFMTKDPFDYSKYDGVTIGKKLETPWQTLLPASKIDIAQSRVVVYWGKNANIKVNCHTENGDFNDNKVLIKEDTLYIKQSNCYLVLPKLDFDFKTYQSKITLIKPNINLSLDSEQSKIEISEIQGGYNYSLSGSQSDLENFNSNPNALEIKGKFYQSSITPYKY